MPNPNPYQPVIEALSGTMTPENALRVIAYVHGLPELIQAVSERLTRDGTAYAEDFPSEPEAAEFAVSLGVLMARLQVNIADFGDTFRRVHERDLRRLESPRRREEAWDYGRNRNRE
jgi:hypothetical protein